MIQPDISTAPISSLSVHRHRKMPHSRAKVGRAATISLLLVSGLCFFLVKGSRWYWECNAQLDPVTLLPVNCGAPKSAAVRPECEGRLWPAFGSCADHYEGLSAFWSDDPLSSLFQNFGTAVEDVSVPMLRDSFVPSWNAVFQMEKNRDLVAAAFGSTSVVLLGLVVKDLYDHFMDKR